MGVGIRTEDLRKVYTSAPPLGAAAHASISAMPRTANGRSEMFLMVFHRSLTRCPRHPAGLQIPSASFSAANSAAIVSFASAL